MNEAAIGFRNFGQLIATAHVSKNLNVPFEDLKARVTSTDAMSLGKAIHELRPGLSNSEVEQAVRAAKRAEKEARKTGKEQIKSKVQS